MNKRCVCGKVITSRFDLCNRCQVEYGYDRSMWPAWLVYMVADIKREMRQDNIIDVREISTTDLESA
jgi:hypothetical protein